MGPIETRGLRQVARVLIVAWELFDRSLLPRFRPRIIFSRLSGGRKEKEKIDFDFDERGSDPSSPPPPVHHLASDPRACVLKIMCLPGCLLRSWR